VGANFHVDQNLEIGVENEANRSLAIISAYTLVRWLSGKFGSATMLSIAPHAFMNFDAPDDMGVFTAQAIMKKKSS
jgi:hypothetical protein